ncbi:uncharacterized protein TNCV_3946111 [Trichonephila clavipes]|nr:uncharacterized protein TNCV_3946111 [Trichonephila clavipes]
MVSSAGHGQVPHPSIVPECFTINQLWNDRCTWPWGHCLLSELREWKLQTGRHNRLKTVRSAGCKVSPVPACEECPRSACLPFSRRRIKKRFPVFSPAMLRKKRRIVKVAKKLRVEIDITLPKIEFRREFVRVKTITKNRLKSLLEGILVEKQEARELKERQETRE